MSSMWKLPEEIQVDIFLRLPVNSILASRCVCKPLCNLLSKPSFIKNHLNLSNKNNNPRLLFGQSQYDLPKKPRLINSIDYKSISSSSSSSSASAVSMEYPFEKIHTETIVTLGSCNGLICMGVSGGGMGIDEKNWICIWNPSTGQYRNIKVSRSEFLEGWNNGVRYGFGYDSNVDDYKLVRISGHVDCWGKDIKIYTLGSKSWKTIQSSQPYHFDGQLHKSIHGVLINGALHWSGSTVTTEGTYSELIIRFDINNERLMDLPFPEETVPPLQEYPNMYREVGVLGDCLCVVFSVIGIQTDVWVMQDYGVGETWSKVFTTTQLKMTRDPCFKPIWSFENGDILVYACEQLSLCDKNNGETRKVLFRGINMSRYLESYVESLVSFKSKTYVKKRTTNGNKKMPERQRT